MGRCCCSFFLNKLMAWMPNLTNMNNVIRERESRNGIEMDDTGRTGYQGMYKVRVTKSLGFPLFFNAVARLLLYSYKTSVSLHI